MSTVHSTPPAATASHQRSHPVGFNEHAHYDPFLAPLPSEEHLIPFASDDSPGHQSYYTPSPSQAYDSVSPANNSNYLQPSSQSTLANNFLPSHPSHVDVHHEAAGAAYDFLSPNTYNSDTGYVGSSEHTTTPDFGGNSFYPGEDNYGLIADSNVDLNDPPLFRNDQLQEPLQQHSPYTRISAGTATLSSHLMSPELTDSGDPISRYGTNSPPERNIIKHEEQERPPDAMCTHQFSQGNVNHTMGTSQITPSVTESSKGTSPDLAAILPVAKTASPMIRVDGYSGGDPSAQRPAVTGNSSSKRSGAGNYSSHLTVRQSEEGGEYEGAGDYFAGARDPFDQVGARSGLDPQARTEVSNIEIPNLKEQEVQAQVVLKNQDVKEWLDRSGPGSDESVNTTSPRPNAINKRQRAKTTGAQVLSRANLESLRTANADSLIPGPGVLIYEESGDDDDYDEEDAASIESLEDDPNPATLSGQPVNDKPGEARAGVYDEIPNQPPLYRAKLWQDPLYDSSDPGIKMQPETASAAIMRFQQRAGDIETLSRVATWGTRRMSESDLNSLFNQLSFNEKTQEPVKQKRDRRGSFLQQLSGKLGSKRSNINLKRQDSDKSIKMKDHSAHPPPPEHNRKDSQGGRKESLGVPQAPPSGLIRMSSLSKRQKSPRIHTGNAMAAMAIQAGALGTGGSVSATGTSSPTAWPKNMMKRSRSRSELNSLGSQGPASSSATELGQSGLAAMWTKQGGPPMPTLATPLKNEETLNSLADVEDDEDDDLGDDHGVKMDLSIRSDVIVPTLEGFKSNIRELNPRLPPFMFDRIAQEQLRRFKKLMDFKVKHTRALNAGKCPSEKHCVELGGEPTYMPPKSSTREQELPQTGFSVTGLAQSDEDAEALAEGTVTPSLFPQGVPMPPVKRLPAEFECSLCFKVKKFQKPSDWSKHVHEDVQPFTCTFPTCAEPKSFKRKADWVRHENERHRQLEWWTCNMNDCSHKCYRKDNFVQHLVREHKLPEPKVKTTKTGKPAVRGPSSQKARNRHMEDNEGSNDEIDYVWRLVDECRHETPKDPKDEACKFCGNVCNSWKKLTVHLAKHMEQISMPILGLVKQQEVTADTIISPIEQRVASQQASMSPTMQSPFSHVAQTNSTAPYEMPVHALDALPGAFTSLQSQHAYFGSLKPNQQSTNFQRVSPNTYPPPNHTQQPAVAYAQHHGAAPFVPGYGSYPESPASQFLPVNTNGGFSHPQTSTPENMYGSGGLAPTSQPRMSPFNESTGYGYFPQQQQNYSSPVDNTAYRVGNTTSASYPPRSVAPNSYPSQQQVDSGTPTYNQQQASMQGQMPMNYHQMRQMPNFAPVSSDISYLSQQQQQQQQRGYGQR